MNALTRSPYRGLDLVGEFDQLLNGFFSPTRHNHVSQGKLIPALDIVENEDSYTVRADLPGVNKEDLSVSVKDKLLTIEASSKQENVEKEGETVIKLERRSGSYCRTLKLGNSVDQGKISAQYTDGVLTLVLPKAEQEVSRKIEVAVH